jgi:hypothetical protein
MNYAHSYRSDFSSSFWKLDYSRGVLPVLFEFNLDETEGLPAPVGFDGLTVKTPFGFDRFEGGRLVRRFALATLNGSPINWDGDNVPNETGSNVDNNDVNYAGPNPPVGGLDAQSPNQVLNSFDDWANIQLAMPDALSEGAKQEPNYPTNEPPPAPVLVAWLNANIPAAACAADIFPIGNGDGAVGPGDLGQLLSKWGTCPAPCSADLFPVGAPDGVVGPGDLGQLLSAWGQCR